MTEYAYKIENTSNRFPILKDGKWGFIDKTGKVVIRPEYDYVEEFSEGLALVRINTSRSIGRTSSDRVGEHSASFSDDLQSRSKSRYGFIDEDGNNVIEMKYDYADSFSEGLALFRTGTIDEGTFGYIDKFGNTVIEPEFPYRDFTKNDQNFSEGLAPVRINRKMGFIDKMGRVVIETQFDNAWGFSEDLALVRTGDMRKGKYGFIDKQGQTVINLKYKMAKPFSEGLACAQIEDWGKGKYGFINKNGQWVIKPQYDRAESFSEGLAGVWIGDVLNAFLSILSMVPNPPEITGTWHYLEKSGTCNFKIRNGWVGSFSEGLVQRKFGGVSTYLDRRGSEVIKTHFDIAKPFSNDLALVKVGNKWGYINKSGMYIWEPTN